MTESPNSPSVMQRWLTLGSKLLAGVLVLSVLLVVTLLASLRLPAVRGAILDWAGSAVEKSTGIHVEAADFAVSLRSGQISLFELKLQAESSPLEPFVEIPSAEVQLSWRSLLSDRPQIYSLRIQQPELDLGSRLPEVTQQGQADSQSLFPALDIHDFELVEGVIRSGEAPEALDIWWDRWQVAPLTLGGSLIAGELKLQVRDTEAHVESHRRPPLTVAVSTELSVLEDGGIAVDTLEVVGDGLNLEVEGQGRLEADRPFQVSGTVRADIARLVSDLTSSGRLEGDVDLTVILSPVATVTGDIRASVQDFPADLLEPLVASTDLQGLRLQGTHLDLTAQLQANVNFDELATSPADNLVNGTVQTTWRRQEEPLLVASVQTYSDHPAKDGQGIGASFEIDLLPVAEGRRSFDGAIYLPGWSEWKEAVLGEVHLRIHQEDLRSLMVEIGLSPEVLGGLQPAGDISLTARLNGPLQTPDIELEGNWRLQGRRLIELSARASAMSHLSFGAELLPDSPGARQIKGGWAFSGLEGLRKGSLDNVRIQIDLPDLAVTLVELEELLEVFVPDPDRRQVMVATLTPEIRERLQGSLQADLTAQGPLRSPTIELTGRWVPADSEHLSVKASFDGQSVTVSELTGALRGLLSADEVLRFAAQGHMDIETPVRSASLDLQVFEPIEEIRQLDVIARLQGGTLTLDASAPSVPGRLAASIPLGVLAKALPEWESLANLPLALAPGVLELEISELGLTRASDLVFYLTGTDFQNLEIAGVLDAVVSMSPQDPLVSIGTLEIAALDLSYGDVQILSDRDLRVDLEEGHIALQPARLRVVGPRSDAPLDLALSADLNRDWDLQAGFEELVDDLQVDLEGTVDSSILTPFLAGGAATGPVLIEAGVHGSPRAPEAEIRISGPDASLILPGRYRTRISEPEIEIAIDPSGAEIRVGRMQLNRGEVEISGTFGEDKVLRLAAQLDGVRYRLDHGLTVALDGNLAVTWPQEGQRRVSGMIDLERGSLRRNLRLEQELIRMLNPSDLAGSPSAFTQSVDLNIDLVTREGVRVKNNLADLRADWDLIRVRGTLAEPTIAGRIDIDPGGFLTAYGQTVRIDQGALIFSGVAGEPPRMDFETTSSSEDPRIKDQWNSVWSTGPEKTGPGGGFWDRYDPQAGSAAFHVDDITTSMTSYFQNRFLQSISGGAPRVELTVQPLPLMGETDTTARVTMSYHLSPQISYVLSQNPREAEGRTDILNLHNFAFAPSLQGQLFRNDQGNQGLTLQQTLEFGGAQKAEDVLPRLRAIDLTAPKEIRKRNVRRATGLRRGQPLAEGDDFDIEIDMLDALARRGFPAADVGVELEPAARNRVRVGIMVEPGPRVDFEFTGDRPRRRARQDIVALYQPTGMQNSPALETIRRDTVRALRAQGFLDPHVEVTAEHTDPGNAASDRVIHVHGEGKRQVNPHVLEFRGLPDDVERTLVGLFSTRLSRVELAMEEAVADDLFRQSMQTMGYPRAQISSRELSSDGSALFVEVDPGPRRHIAEVQVLGVDGDLRSELDEIHSLSPGDPLWSSHISHTAFLMEDHLREKGFANARVQTRLEPTTSDDDSEIDLFFDVQTGSEYRIGELHTEGLANSSPSWVKKVSQLEPGELLTDSSLTLTRRRLARTGVFQRIAIRRDEPTPQEAKSLFAPITFELEEHPRYRVTYGIRGETTREAGAVVNLSDLNFLGRGQTLGLRLIYSTLERNARLYWSIPRVRQTNKTLEFFVEARREESVSLVDDAQDPASVVASIREAWAQITFPLGTRSVHRFYTVYKQSITEDRSDPGSEEQRVVSPFSGWQVSYDTGERSFFETSTDNVTVFLGSDLSFASESLGSDYTGYGLFGQIKPQIPLLKIGDSALVWVHNYRIGAKESRDDEPLPFFDRLFAGGEFSVRGYPTNSLGPVSDSGVALGGEAMFVTNQELRFPLWTLLSGVAFFDAGNVWETLDAVESTLFKSIGLGLRADSPIGPLRLDFAYPLDRREGDPEYKVYFGLGQTF